MHLQRQPPRGVSRNRCSENMQQIYRRTPMPKDDFNKVALQLYWNHTSAWVATLLKSHFDMDCNFIEIALRHGCSPVNLLHIFRTPFLKNTSERLLLMKITMCNYWRTIEEGRQLICPFIKILEVVIILSNISFNPFVPNAPLLYPLKTSENFTVSWCF